MNPVESHLHVEDSGAGDPVLLLHSSGLSGRQWRRLSAELPENGFRAVVPDLSGHGRSEPWPEPVPFSFRTDVEHVLEILRQIAPAHVVAHSYGGFVALHAALTAPAAVRSLVLFDPVAFGALDPKRDGDAREVLAKVDLSWGPRAEDRERWVRSFVNFWGGPGAWAALREEVRAEFRRVAWVVREGVGSMEADATSFDALRAFEPPVHLVTGEASPLPAKRVVERLAELARQATIATIPGAGHLAPATHPGLVNRVVLDALQSGARPLASP